MSCKFSTSNTQNQICKSRLLSLNSQLVKNMNAMRISFWNRPRSWLLIVWTWQLKKNVNKELMLKKVNKHFVFTPKNRTCCWCECWWDSAWIGKEFDCCCWSPGSMFKRVDKFWWCCCWGWIWCWGWNWFVSILLPEWSAEDVLLEVPIAPLFEWDVAIFTIFSSIINHYEGLKKENRNL